MGYHILRQALSAVILLQAVATDSERALTEWVTIKSFSDASCSLEIRERMVRHKTHVCLPDNRMLRCISGSPNAEFVKFRGPDCTGVGDVEPAPISGTCHSDSFGHWMTWDCGFVGTGLAVMLSYDALDCPSTSSQVTTRRYVVGECEPYGALHAKTICVQDGFVRGVYSDQACTQLIYSDVRGECSNDRNGRSRSSKAVSCNVYVPPKMSYHVANQARGQRKVFLALQLALFMMIRAITM